MSTRLDPVSGRCVGGPAGQPGLIRLQNWTLANYGGQALGIYSCRTVRGGKGMSVHSEGRAFDWRAPNRAVLDGYFQTLVQHANALNIQAIHDYDNNRRWTGKGWQKASIGKAPYKWETHVERNWDGARDARPIADIIRGQATPTTPFPPSPKPPRVPERPAPVDPGTHVKEEDVQTNSVVLAHRGFGRYVGGWNPNLGRDPIICGAVMQGPAPDQDVGGFYDSGDGWWEHNERAHVRAQPRGGQVIVTATLDIPPGVAPEAELRVFVAIA